MSTFVSYPILPSLRMFCYRMSIPTRELQSVFSVTFFLHYRCPNRPPGPALARALPGPAITVPCPGLTKPVGTGPVWPVTVRPSFGLGRYQTGPNSKFKFEFKKKSQKDPKNTSRCDESNGVKFSQNSFISYSLWGFEVKQKKACIQKYTNTM